MRECGVFGVSSNEYLDYAQANRQEWEKKGQEVVQKYLEKSKRDMGMKEDGDEQVDIVVDGGGGGGSGDGK